MTTNLLPRGLGFRLLFAKLFGKFVDLVKDLSLAAYDGIIPPLLGYQGMCELIVSGYPSSKLYMSEQHNKSGLYLWEQEAISKYFTQGAHFMCIAAGGGREMLALLSRGAHVDAWECTKGLRDCGNRILRGMYPDKRIQPVPPNKFPVIPKGTRYDFCIIGFSAYSHILRRKDRISVLTEAGKVVDGAILISFPQAGRSSRARTVLRRLASQFPGATKGISLDLVARPGSIAVGFDKKTIGDEAAAAGLILKKYSEHPPEYPYALLEPRS